MPERARGTERLACRPGVFSSTFGYPRASRSIRADTAESTRTMGRRASSRDGRLTRTEATTRRLFRLHELVEPRRRTCGEDKLMATMHEAGRVRA